MAIAGVRKGECYEWCTTPCMFKMNYRHYWDVLPWYIIYKSKFSVKGWFLLLHDLSDLEVLRFSQFTLNLQQLSLFVQVGTTLGDDVGSPTAPFTLGHYLHVANYFEGFIQVFFKLKIILLLFLNIFLLIFKVFLDLCMHFLLV